MAVCTLVGLFYLSLGQPSPDKAGNHYKEANVLFANGSLPTNPNVQTKSMLFGPQTPPQKSGCQGKSEV